MNKETIEEANWKVLGTKTDTFYNGAKSDAARDYWFKIFKEQSKKN